MQFSLLFMGKYHSMQSINDATLEYTDITATTDRISTYACLPVRYRLDLCCMYLDHQKAFFKMCPFCENNFKFILGLSKLS